MAFKETMKKIVSTEEFIGCAIGTTLVAVILGVILYITHGNKKSIENGYPILIDKAVYRCTKEASYANLWEIR